MHSIGEVRTGVRVVHLVILATFVALLLWVKHVLADLNFHMS